MEFQSAADQVFQEYQNRFRGLVSDFKSKKFVEKRAVTPARTFRSAYRKLLLDARLALTEAQFGPYLDWTAHQLETQLPELARTPTGYDELDGVHVCPATTLERELRWIASRLRSQAKQISTFRSLVQLIEIMVVRGKPESAIEALEALQLAFGTSLWSVQLRIALEHLAGGLERQKRYATAVRAVYRQGLLGFVAYHTSVRNEDKSTPAKFVEHILGRIERHARYADDVKTYMRFRLAGQWPATPREAAWVLQIEQSHHLIDVYETFVACAQEIVSQDHFADVRAVLAECIALLPVDADFRLAKIATLLIGTPPALHSRRRDISDALLTGDVLKSARAFARTVRRPEVDVWDMLYGGLAFSFGAGGSLPTSPHPGQAHRMLAIGLGVRPEAHEALDQLGKIATNFRGLPFGAGLAEAVGLLTRTSPIAQWRPWLLGLNSPSQGIEDYAPTAHHAPLGSGPTDKAWSELISPTDVPATDLPSQILNAMGLLIQRRPGEAVARLAPLQQAAGQSPMFALATNLLLHATMASAPRSTSIDLLADAATLRPGQRGLLPVRATLEDASFSDFRDAASPLSAPIALHMLWLMTEKDITRSQLRYATGAALRVCGVDRPSELATKADLPLHQVVYFLSEVCKIDVLDVLRSIKSTRATLEERYAILTALREIDPANGRHGDELMAIGWELTLVEGQWIVDHTRIHVDTAALRRWADRELLEDFERYQDLVEVDAGPQPSFDEVLKELASGNSRIAAVPETEADAVLHSMVHRLGEEFLNNPLFGLDFYLSKRIRHQSFIGRIRGPLEFAHLITTRETESSPYHRNEHWLARFKASSPEQLAAINQALERCARDFDEILRDAKDRLFHIQSTERPDGLLHLNLTPQIIQLVRSIMLWEPEDFGGFYEVTVATLWAALEPSLQAVRRYITEDLKTAVTTRLEQARAEVRAAAGPDPAYADFDIEFGTRSTEVQRALDDAASWFTFTQIERLRRTFTLEEAVRVGRDNALRCQRGFEPGIETNIQGGVEITAPGLVIIHDTLFIALDNIRAHSGERAPKAQINVAHSPDGGTLTIEVVSDCKPQHRSKAEKSLREIQDILEGGAPTRRTKKEGGSGLLKLDAVARQSPKGRLEFGFVQGGRFRLSVTYSFIYERQAEPAAA